MTSRIVAQHPSQSFESSVRQGDGSFVLGGDGDVVEYQEGEVLFRRVFLAPSQEGEEGGNEGCGVGVGIGVGIDIRATSLFAPAESHHVDPLSGARGVFRKSEKGSQGPRRDVRRGVGRNERGERRDVEGQAVEGGRGVEGGLNAEEGARIGGGENDGHR